MIELKQGQSTTIGILIADGYDMSNIDNVYLYINQTKFTPAIIDRMLRVEMSSKTTSVFIGTSTVRLIFDDKTFGRREYVLENIVWEATKARVYDDSVDFGYTVTYPITISETAIEAGDVMYDYVKGSAGSLSSVTASVDSNVGTPEVIVTYDGESADFAFKNLKGDKGEQGEQGEKGDDAVLPDGVVIDPNYVHTDNNYTTADKAKVQSAIQTETDPTVPAWAKEPTKPTYTASEVGLGNVDNTSDASKPISNATQTALNNKVDKVTGSSLIDDTEIDKLSEYPEFEDLKFLHKNLTDKNAEPAFQHLDTTTEKTTPIDADSFGLWDSVTSTFKRLSVANMLTWFRGLQHTFTQLISFSGGVKLTKIVPTSDASGVVVRNAADTEDVFNLDITNKKFSQSDNFSLRTASTNYYKDLEFAIKPNNGTGSIIFKPSSGNDMQFVMPSANNINNIIFGIRNGRAFICNALNNVTSGEFHLGGQSWGSDGAIIIKANKDVGIGTTVPQSKLHVNGGIQFADDTAAASLLKVGTTRYRPAANGSYYEICMQTGANTFVWHTLAQYTW